MRIALTANYGENEITVPIHYCEHILRQATSIVPKWGFDSLNHKP